MEESSRFETPTDGVTLEEHTDVRDEGNVAAESEIAPVHSSSESSQAGSSDSRSGSTPSRESELSDDVAEVGEEFMGKSYSDLDSEAHAALNAVNRDILEKHRKRVQRRHEEKMSKKRKDERIRAYWIKKRGTADFLNPENVRQEYIDMNRYRPKEQETVIPEEYRKAESLRSLTFAEKFEELSKWRKRRGQRKGNSAGFPKSH